jgi:hypothetical protein
LTILVATATYASACPFCTMQGQTLADEVKQADMVLYGKLINGKLDPNDFGGGTTDLVVENVLKKHAILGDKKVVTLPRYVPEDKKYKYLIFCGVFQNKIDPYRGITVKADSDMVKYIEGAIAARPKGIGERLRFFFDYLDSPDIEISNDAYKEFGNADYKDFRTIAKDLPADRVAKWLDDPNTPVFRYGLYASMLGHSGKPEHAQKLRAMLDDPKKRGGSGVDGILAGYVMLQPKEGWPYLLGVIKDDKKEFMARYAALRAVRFLWDSRPDLIDKKELLVAFDQLLDQGDIADLAIEDLRQRGCWDMTDRVVKLYGQKSHDVPIVRRAILRFVLLAPNKPSATALLAELRRKDPELVKDAEELLKLETKPAAAPAASVK